LTNFRITSLSESLFVQNIIWITLFYTIVIIYEGLKSEPVNPGVKWPRRYLYSHPINIFPAFVVAAAAAAAATKVSNYHFAACAPLLLLPPTVSLHKLSPPTQCFKTSFLDATQSIMIKMLF
jgi:hypothetical protein